MHLHFYAFSGEIKYLSSEICKQIMANLLTLAAHLLQNSGKFVKFSVQHWLFFLAAKSLKSGGEIVKNLRRDVSGQIVKFSEKIKCRASYKRKEISQNPDNAWKQKH